MTSRLLRASLGSPGYEGMRRVLREQGATTVASLRDVTVTAASLPLFQRGDDGALRQVVRVRASGVDAPLTVRLLDGETVLDTTELTTSADLLVPEVTGRRTVTVETADGAAVLGTTPFEVVEQRKWSVHLVHHSHLDIGYTDPQGDVLRNHLRYLDSALDYAAATDDWPDDARFRWTVESALPVRRYVAERPARTVARLVELAKAGRIEVTAMPFQMHTEAASTEELHRQLVLTDELHRRHGIPIVSAMHTDVPGAVVGFVDALAAAGVRYLSAAHNWAGRAVPYRHGGQALGRPFWWRAPSGNRLLVWFTDTAHGMAYMEGNIVGLPHGYADALDLLPGYLHALAHRPYVYGRESFGWSGMPAEQVTKEPYPFDLLHIRVQGADADNAGPSLVPAEVVRRWNETWAYPRLRNSTNGEFLATAAERVGDRLDEHTGDWTDWWADGLGSGARPLGYARRAQNTVRAAETLHTMADLAGDDAADARPAVDAVYDGLGLFDEHTWGAANPWHDSEDGFDSGGRQWARKAEVAYRAHDDAEDLRSFGERRLGALLRAPEGVLASYAVVNPGSRTRTDVVTLFLPASAVPLGTAIGVVDARTGSAVAHHEDVVSPVDQPTRAPGRRVRFLATDIPSVGHARFDLVPGDGPEPVQTWAAPTIESDRYRVEFDLAGGVVASIFDKALGRELVNTSALAGMNQYVYDAYATRPHVNHLSGHVEDSGDLELLAGRSVGHGASLVRAERTAVGERFEVAMNGDGVDGLRVRVEVPFGVPRVEITDVLEKRAHPDKESVFFAFPFDVPGAEVCWELTGGVGGTRVPQVPGSATHHQPIRHWVVARNDEVAVAWATLEAPLTMVGDLHLPYLPYPPTLRPDPPEPATLYSWALNNVWDTNFPSQQQGQTTFRYAITSGTGVAARVLGPRVAAGLTDPFVAVELSSSHPAEPQGRDGTPAEPEAALVSVGDELVHVSALGRSRTGHDLVVYLRSLAPDTREVTVTTSVGVRAAYAGTSLEHDLTELPVRDGETVRVTVPAGDLIALVLDRSS